MATQKKPLTAEDIAKLAVTYIGPTWRKNEDGSWHLPQWTLGWQIAGWCAEYLRGPNGGPWRFTDEQLRFVLWWYAVDEYGRFIYRRGALQRLKGWGKDPLLAVICLVEFVGPSRFSHWGANGEPVAVAHPNAWVQIAAVSRDQTKNTMTLLPSLITERLKAEYGIKDGAELYRANGGRQRLEAVTSNYRSLEGARSTFVVLNETHHWISGNGGHDMYETVDGNTTKMDSRYLAITNAFVPGEDSVAERMRDDWNQIADGFYADPGYLYDSIEAHPNTPLTIEALRIVIPKIRGDSVWLNIDSIIASVLNKSIPKSRSRRMWLNQIVASEESLYSLADWTPLEIPGATLKPGDEIFLGLDGGKTDDDTALVAIRLSDMCAFVLGHWYKPDGPAAEGWIVPRESVDSAVHDAFRIFKVLGFYSDVAYWESYISSWDDKYGDLLAVKAPGRDAIGWDMRASLKLSTLAHERLMRSIFDGKLHHDGDRALRRHILNVVQRVNNYGVSFGKESRESPRKVDLYAALMLAHEAMSDYRARGKKQVRKGGSRGWFL